MLLSDILYHGYALDSIVSHRLLLCLCKRSEKHCVCVYFFV